MAATTSIPETIFTFWEPKSRMTPYLRLCLQTWESRRGTCELVVLDYACLPTYLGDGGFDMQQLARLPMPIQKDAVMVAVLRRHGGIFLDVDTLAVADIGPLLATLTRAEVTLVERHMAFMAARAGACLLDHWYDAIRTRLDELARREVTPEIPWDFLGNSLLLESMDAVIVRHEDKPLLVGTLDRSIALLRRLAFAKGSVPATAWLQHGARRVWSAAVRRRRDAYFATRYRHHLTSLDRTATGYMPERPWFAGQKLDDSEQYRRFWFSDEIGVEAVLAAKPRLIGLHNSWTPQWYANLSEADVLTHGCLLSRTLRHLLAGR